MQHHLNELQSPTASHNEEAFHHITKQRKQIASIRTAAGS
jgi:hypothetical protein